MTRLTPREREVAGLMSLGLSNLGIAMELHLTPRTVESHVRQILRKLGGPDDGLHDRRVVAILNYLKVADLVSIR